MLNLVETPLTREATFLGSSPSPRTPRQISAVRVRCSSSSSFQASGFHAQKVTTNDERRTPSSAGGGRRSSETTPRVASAGNPLYSDEPENGRSRKAQNGAAASRSARVEMSAKGKWRKNRDSSLSGDEPLPLPMTWPDSTPADKEEVDKMLSCNPETQFCKAVVYQWTGDCPTCQGTGLVSFYRKRHEVISKCINCLGIGSVHKITSRADIQDMDDTPGSSNGSAYGSPRTNGLK